MTSSHTTNTPTIKTAASFLDSIAINTHAGFGWDGYDNVRVMTQNLDYIGVTTLRDSLGISTQAQQVVEALASAGYKFDFTVSSALPAHGQAGLDGFIDAITAFQETYPDSIIAVEGLNEVNIQPFTYNGFYSLGAAAQFQKDLYTAMKAEESLDDIAVYNMTLANDQPLQYFLLGDLTAWSDYANSHAYVSNSAWSVDAAMDFTVGLAQTVARDKPTVITETGYSTLATTNFIGADEAASAKMTLNNLVTAFQNGVEKTYLYELMDRSDDPNDMDHESHFGLFNNDGSPKLAATALHNLTRILEDDGSGDAMPTAELEYSLSNMPSRSDSFVLAKSNGAYDLVVWATPTVWNAKATESYDNAVHTVKLHLNEIADVVHVYDPLDGKTPIATYTNVQDIDLPISDYPLIIEVGGSLADHIEDGTPVLVEFTAAEFVAQIGKLEASTTLEKIVLSDSQILSVASIETMNHMIAHDQSALSKIEGEFQFKFTQSGANWKKTEIYNSDGVLESRTEAGIKDGLVVTQKTAYANGDIEVANFSQGEKIGEVTYYADGSKDIYSYGLNGVGYVAQHSVYNANGSLALFERLAADGLPIFREEHDNGTKVVSWYAEGGVITKEVTVNPDGTRTTLYADDLADRDPVTGTPAPQPGPVPVMEPEPAPVMETITTEVSSLLDLIGSLKDALTIDKIVLTDHNLIPITSIEGMKGLIADAGSVLSKIEGGFEFVLSTSGAGWQETRIFDAAGETLSTTTKQSNNNTETTKIANADGSQSVQTLTNGVKTLEVETKADGTRSTSVYDDLGVIQKHVEKSPDGEATTTFYADGAVTQILTIAVDQSRVLTLTNLENSSYTQEERKFDPSGTLVETVRTDSDGTLVHRWTKASDGSATTTTYDDAGNRMNELTVHADGAKDLFKFAVADQPGAVRHESYDASNALKMVDVANADGSHRIVAKATGLTLLGGEGDDMVTLHGGDTFVFSGGRDTISNFHADDSAANHDTIQIARSMAADFSDLTISQSGADTVVRINDMDMILMKNVDIQKVGAGDFLFA